MIGVDQVLWLGSAQFHKERVTKRCSKHLESLSFEEHIAGFRGQTFGGRKGANMLSCKWSGDRTLRPRRLRWVVVFLLGCLFGDAEVG